MFDKLDIAQLSQVLLVPLFDPSVLLKDGLHLEKTEHSDKVLENVH